VQEKRLNLVCIFAWLLFCGAAILGAVFMVSGKSSLVVAIFRYTLVAGSLFFLLRPLVHRGQPLTLSGFLYCLSGFAAILISVAVFGESLAVLLRCC